LPAEVVLRAGRPLSDPPTDMQINFLLPRPPGRRRPRPTPIIALLAAVALLLGQSALADEQPVIGHRIDAVLDPGAGTLRATDQLTLPDGVRQIAFLLHAGLAPRVSDGSAVLERIGRDGHLERFRLTLGDGSTTTLSYGGSIRHAPERIARRVQDVDAELWSELAAGDVLFIDSSHVAKTGSDVNHLCFEVLPRLRPGVLVHVHDIFLPQDYLKEWAIAQNRSWNEQYVVQALLMYSFAFRVKFGCAYAYLRLPEEALANRYLDATADYLARYSALIGDYPYAKFALVENFWETGYGMPSFTLLGSRVLRLPFILTSSYPHEILHNWWGNSVYIDYASGNWAEGLTAYLSDHLNQAIDGRGADYRRDQLKAYADYVQGGEDVPLTEFRARHGSASQAIGYGRRFVCAAPTRVGLGDDAFRSGLRTFYRQNRFRTASFADLRFAFELATNQDLSGFFDAWTTRTGAAELKLGDVQVTHDAGGGYVVTGSVYQVQPEPQDMVDRLIAVCFGAAPPRRVLAPLGLLRLLFEAKLATAPARVAVDPEFDTFRRLLPEESPASLSSLFGAEAGIMVLPAAAPGALKAAYRQLATAWQQGHPGWRVVEDSALDGLPDEGAVWLFGWENAFLDELAVGGDLALDAGAQKLTLAGEEQAGVSVALATGGPERPIGWVAAATSTAVPGLARKLPHYGKYGWLTFTGDAPDNQQKGQWPPGDSALTQWLTDARPLLLPPPRSPLAPR